jgi:AcrR family transcriptional regulator
MEQPSAPGTPDEDPLRAQLLDAAARVFAEKGYFGARVIDIVRAAGLSSGAVYGRFDSKDELLMEAVLRRVDEHAVGLRFQGKTVGAIVLDTSRSDGELDDAEATQLEAFVAARREPKVAEAIALARARWRATIGEALIQQAVAEGAAPDADFDSIIYFFEALNLGLLVQRGAGQLPPDPGAWTRYLARVVRSMGELSAEGGSAPATEPPEPEAHES